MIQTYLSSLIARSDSLVSSYLLVGKFWKIRVTAVSFLLVLFFSFPHYYYFSNLKYHDYSWDFIHQKVKDPFGENKERLGTNEHNKQYRLTPVLIAGILDTTHKIRVVGLLTLIEHIFGITFFYLVLKLAYEITADKLVSSYFCLGFSFIFLGKDFFWDVSTWLIPFAYFFTLLVVVTRNLPVLFLSLLLGFWSDERMLLFSPILLLWWKLYIPKKFNAFSLVYIVNLFLYFGVRYYLFTHFIKGTESYKLHPRSTGADYFWCLYEQFNHIPLGMWLPFEGYWLFLILFVVYAYQSRLSKDFKWFLLAFITFLGALVVSFSILDTTKSLTLIFPLLFISLKMLHKTESPVFVKNVIITAVSISFFFPTYYFKGDYAWMSPVYYTPVKESIGWLLNTFVHI